MVIKVRTAEEADRLAKELSARREQKPEPVYGWDEPTPGVDKPIPAKPPAVRKPPVAKQEIKENPGAKYTEQIALRIPVDVLEAFRSQGRGYQRRINDVLRDYAQEKGWL